MTTPDPSSVQPTRHVTSGGARIYTLTLEAFPHLSVNAFLVVVGDPAAPSYTALIDTGSSHPASTAGLEAALDAVQTQWGEQWHWDTLSRVIITHAHPDHVAGLPFVRTLTPAPVAAHVLDLPTIQDPESARDSASLRIEEHLRWMGVSEGGSGLSDYAQRLRKRARNLMLPQGVKVDTVLHGGELLDGHFLVIHTPGHAGGQVCLQLGDVLLSADHLLPHNSPPLMPERFQPCAGLTHYLASLDRTGALSGVEAALGGHGGPMTDWRGRTGQLRNRYADKLGAVLDAAEKPRSVRDLTMQLYPRINPVQALLLLDQTGALVEYLASRGELAEQTGENGDALFQAAVRPIPKQRG